MDVSYGIQRLRKAMEHQAETGQPDFVLPLKDMEALVNECEAEFSAKERTARFKAAPDDIKVFFDVSCCECGHVFVSPSKYCPSCGARMVSE